jgi:3-oxoacyl-[acyl-carrier-protein] synthase II
MSADAGHMTAPNMDGPRRAMLNALRNAGVNQDQVNYLNAHGTSTPLGDANESNAIKAAMGDCEEESGGQLDQVHDGSPAGWCGWHRERFHRDGAARPEDSADHQPDNQDPECDLDYCANVARDAKIEVALKNNFGFGGTNGSLVFKRV